MAPYPTRPFVLFGFRIISLCVLVPGLMANLLVCSEAAIAQELRRKDSSSNPVVLFKTATDFLAESDFANAIALFQQVVQLSPGTPLAIEADYFTLIAKRNQLFNARDLMIQRIGTQVPNAHEHQEYEDLGFACSEWICVASHWKKSVSPEKLAIYHALLEQRLESVLGLDSQLAFLSAQWSKTLASLDQLASHSNASSEDNLAFCRMRLECYIHLQRWLDAQELIQSARFDSEEKFAQSPPPRSLETSLLRKAEVAMVLGKWDDARRSVCNIREHFPECTVSSQVDYVLARCLVHDAEFDEARKVLASVLATQPPPSAQVQIKAWWTIAESYLMQRKFSEAFAAYQRVAEMGADSPWAELADRQLAICQESFGDSVAVEVPASNNANLRSTQKQTPNQPR